MATLKKLISMYPGRLFYRSSTSVIIFSRFILTKNKEGKYFKFMTKIISHLLWEKCKYSFFLKKTRYFL